MMKTSASYFAPIAILSSLLQVHSFAPVALTKSGYNYGKELSFFEQRAEKYNRDENVRGARNSRLLGIFRKSKSISKTGRRHKLRKKASTVAASLAIYSTILLRTPHAALADHPLENAPTGKVSLRPGMSMDQMEKEVRARSDRTIDEQIAAQNESRFSSLNPSGGKAQTKKSKAKKNDKFDMDDEYDFEEEAEGDDDDLQLIAGVAKANGAVLNVEKSGSTKTVTKFSGSAPHMSAKTKNSEIGKTVVKIVGPIFAFCFARETIRWNREQNNVNKGIEIMEQQRQEHLNTKKDDDDDDDDDSDDEDSDDEDSDDEDDDDDSDDEDSDDEDDYPRGKKK